MALGMFQPITVEALTNAAKPTARGVSVVEVCAEATDSHLQLEIRDDGIGGAAPGRVTIWLARVAALGGTITIQSQPATSLLVEDS